MKEVTYFKCEKCGKVSENMDEILACEASHYGLSVEEKKEWDELKEARILAGSVVAQMNNEETRKEYDEAVASCVKYELDHNITY